MPYPHAIPLFLFTGAGSSRGATKPKPKRSRKINLTVNEEGVWQDASAIKEHAAYEAYMKQKEKEDHIRKKTETMRSMSLSDYRQVKREMVYNTEKSTKLNNFWTKNQERLLKELYSFQESLSYEDFEC